MVFADTSGLIAAFDRKDSGHAAGKKAWERFSERRERIVITELVFAETVTYLRRRGDWTHSRAVGVSLRSSRVVEIVPVEREGMDAAWREFVRNPDPRLSLCDAASFMLMRSRSLEVAFTFDPRFRDAGFRTIP